MSTKTVYYESMAILIRGKTREIHGWYLFRKTKIQKTQVENGHTPTFLNSNSIQNFVDDCQVIYLFYLFISMSIQIDYTKTDVELTIERVETALKV